MGLTAVLSPTEVGTDVAFNPETGTTTEGESIEEVLANLHEATTLSLEEFPAVIKVSRVAIIDVVCRRPPALLFRFSMKSSSRV